VRRVPQVRKEFQDRQAEQVVQRVPQV
jgi:hypothetical protein